VLIQITAGKARSQTTKEAFYRRVVEKLVESPGIRKEDVMIVVNTTGPDDWSFANGVMQYMTPIEGAKS
jgi:phenylpyruvate tautomerase PptA (4-oxalocrotonate tautomerase family)